MTKEKGAGNTEEGNAYFTAALFLMTVLVIAVWVIFGCFHRQIFTFFGADEELMPKVMEYAKWILCTLPLFVMPVFVGSFIRNDGVPELAMKAVIIGGCVNVFGDWFFVFPLDMGIAGAAAATVLGTGIQASILCSHFFSKRCRLRLVKFRKMLPRMKDVLSTGIGASVLELGSIFLAVLMNNQIMRYGDVTALAVYGVIATISMLFQALFRGVGQAIQPIVSANYGAGNPTRVTAAWNLALGTVVFMGIGFTAIGQLLPGQIVKLFIAVTPEVLAAAPGIIRPCFLQFLFLGVTVSATYYLQATLHSKMSMTVAMLRSAVLSGLLLILLPIPFGVNGIWVSLPISELVTATIALCCIFRIKAVLTQKKPAP